MSSKIDRAAHGPSWTEVILGAVLSTLLGIILGAALLIIRPVTVAKELPKEADRNPRAVYYVEGSRDAAKAKQALAKRKAFAGGQSVSVTEDEVNSLLAPPAGGAGAASPKAGEKSKADPKAKDAKEAPKAPAADDMVAVGTPAVRIHSGTVQVGVPVTLNLAGLSQRIIVQAQGGFVRQGDLFVFEPSAMYLGSCPVQRLPMVAGFVRDRFINSQPIPEDIKASWTKLAGVAIEGSTLKLTMP